MADFITPFDPSLTTEGKFDVNLTNGGWMFIHNESPFELAFTVGLMSLPVLVPAYTARCFPAPRETKHAKWKQLGQVQPGSQAPISQVFGEAYGPTEWTAGELYTALARQVNVGNPGVSQSVVNDGNPTISTVLETTQAGASGGSNALITNDGAIKSQEWTGVAFNTLFLTIVNALAGNACVSLGKAGNFLVSVACKLRVTGASILDNGAITTDGAGNQTNNGTLKSSQTLSGAAKVFFDLFATDKDEIQLIQNPGGDLAISNATSGVTILRIDRSGNANLVGALATLAGIATTGKRGAAIELARGDDVNVTTTTLTTIASATVPNESPNPVVRCSCTFLVNNGDTNNGIITAEVTYTDPYSNGAATQFFFIPQTPALAQLNAQTVTKATTEYITLPIYLKCKPNTVVAIKWQNTAAGSPFNDFASGIIELL